VLVGGGERRNQAGSLDNRGIVCRLTVAEVILLPTKASGQALNFTRWPMYCVSETLSPRLK
jgi:hypothetical protein